MGARPLCVWCRKREVEAIYRPFCSERCKLADLGQWLSGAYRVPDSPATDDERDDQGAPGSDGEPDEFTPH